MGTNRRRLWAFACVIGATLVPTHAAWAGMTTYTLSDVVAARFENISFFLAVILLAAWGFKACWNVVARDFPKWPRISYRVSCGVMMVMAVLMGFVLTLVSMARELVTPSDWERGGKGGHLSEVKVEEREPQMRMDVARRRGMETLRDVLWSYADGGDGRLPKKFEDMGVAEDLWQAPDNENTPYVYIAPYETEPGTFKWQRAIKGLEKVKVIGDLRKYVVAYEPTTFGEDRYVLFSTGEIAHLKSSELGPLVDKTVLHHFSTNSGGAK